MSNKRQNGLARSTESSINTSIRGIARSATSAGAAGPSDTALSESQIPGQMLAHRIAGKLKRLTQRVVAMPLMSLDLESQAATAERLLEQLKITIQTPTGPISFYASAPRLISRARSILSKEPDMIRWIDSFPENSVFWDIGANVGVFSLYAAARNHARVLAFEPLAANFHILSKNVQLNPFGQTITAYCVALSREPE